MRKLRIKREQDRIILTDSFVRWVSLAVAILLSVIGLGVLFVFVYQELQTGWIDASWGGFCFFLLWSVLALTATFICGRSTHRIVIDAQGIYEKTMLPVRKSRTYQWDEVVDWGISYVSSDRYGTQYYGIYFADCRLPVDKRNDKQKYANRSIMLLFEEYDLDRVEIEVLPYVMQYTEVVPFDGTNAR